ncbi:hypothetical protein LUZ60_001801 [Juncus effusus]|nr:hypothetical protein LUZ60_001801 [Juncus effusus]
MEEPSFKFASCIFTTLGPEREIYQIPVFGELRALFPGFRIYIDFVGPTIPHSRDGEIKTICKYANCFDDNCTCRSSHNTNSSLILKFHKGLYHERYNDVIKDSKPDIIIAPNAGIAAYSSWIPTLELIKEKGISVIFTDYCEEAAYLASSCISSVLGDKLTVPIQVNPFRQPLSVENSVLNFPCYSNCFLFGF